MCYDSHEVYGIPDTILNSSSTSKVGEGLGAKHEWVSVSFLHTSAARGGKSKPWNLARRARKERRSPKWEIE